MPPVVEVVDLVKTYPGTRGGPPVRAVDGISFAVGSGAFFGFLGPNGAGKTTTIRVLATLSRASSGCVRVAGHDPATEAGQVRSRIGIALQAVAVEGLMTGRENLQLAGRLHGLPRRALDTRVDELLELMNLGPVANRLAGAYSGGMRRRLDLATALVHHPEVLFLDEPTEGLDPQSRVNLWDELVRINRLGTTMFLTTHYMEEADRLCHRLAIIDNGRIVVEGTPTELKRDVGADQVRVTLGPDFLARPGAADEAVRAVAGIGGVTAVERAPDGLSVASVNGHRTIPAIVRRLDAAAIVVEGLAMREPTLDDVFLRHCGRHIRTEAADQPVAGGWM